MVRFLNNFAKKAKSLDKDKVEEVEAVFDWFLTAVESVPRATFLSRQQKLMLPLFEAVYAGSRYVRERGLNLISPEAILQIREDSEFFQLSQAKTADTTNVHRRIAIATEKLVTAAKA